MVVQLSYWLSLRNCGLVPLLEKDRVRRGFRDSVLSTDDKKKLMTIIDEIDSLHESWSLVSHLDERGRTIMEGKKVPIHGRSRIIERSRDRQKSAETFLRIYNVLKDYWVDPRLYCDLEGAYRELGFDPPDKVLRASEYASSCEQDAICLKDELM